MTTEEAIEILEPYVPDSDFNAGLVGIPQEKMEEAMQKACDEQAKIMDAEETAEFIAEQYGDVLRKLGKV